MGLVVVLRSTSLFWQGDIIKEIKIKGQSYRTREEILQRLQWDKNETHLPNHLDKLRFALFSDPVILDASFHQKGSVLFVNIVERKCIALIAMKNNQRIHDMDTEGRILSADKELPRCKNVPLVRSDFEKIEDGIVGDKNIKRLIMVLVKIKNAYPSLLTRFSEVRLNSGGGLTFLLSHSAIRVDVPTSMEMITIRRLYASVAYLLSQKIKRGLVDLRGSEAVLYSGL